MSAIIALTPITCVSYCGAQWDDIPKGENSRPLPGAMFYISFHNNGVCETHEPPCSQHLHVVCPDGHWWDIDGRASNCTLKDDKVHRCWVRHGEPPLITVDKNGVTCQAGAGSIQTPDWHGFLRDGVLTT